MKASGRGTWVVAVGIMFLTTSAAAGVQRDLAAAYHVLPGPGGLQAENPAHRLALTFTTSGPEVADAKGRWHWGMTLARWGRAGALRPAAAANVVIENNRVEYKRGAALTEWYCNTARGLEQGFTLTRRPSAAGMKDSLLVLELDLAGTLRPVLESGQGLVLQDAAGTTRARYAGLMACDADGRRLAARLALSGNILRINVDDRRARYPVVVDPWIQKAKITASDGAANDDFGCAVAIEGDTAVAGATGASAAYVFERSANNWVQVGKLEPDSQLGGFARAVAIDGNTVVVGVPDNNRAMVFVKPPAGWQDMTQTAVLTPDDGTGKNFGCSVGISGDTVVAGAHNDDVGGDTNRGSAYVFIKPAGGWDDMTQTAKLTASDGEQEDHFGWSAGISGDTIVVGAYQADWGADEDTGAAYVFEKPVGGWADMTETARLMPSDPHSSDQFGYCAAISGDTAAVGAWLDDNSPNGFNSGMAYVFTRPPAGWADASTQDARLRPENGAAFDGFGYAVAVSGDAVAVGADEDLAYAFEKPAAGWEDMTETAELEGIGRQANDNFGGSVAVSGGTALVGASGDNASRGAVYVFVSPGAARPWQMLLLETD